MTKKQKTDRPVKLTKHRVKKLFETLRLNDPNVVEHMKYLEALGKPSQSHPQLWIQSDAVSYAGPDPGVNS